MNRKILMLIVILFPLFTIAQKDTIPKKANLILIKGAGYNDAVLRILDQGYQIESADSVLKIIKTPKAPALKKKSLFLSIFVRVKDSIAYVSATGSNNIGITLGTVYSPPDYYTIANYGAKNSPARNLWNELNEFALSFNKPVEYLVK